MTRLDRLLRGWRRIIRLARLHIAGVDFDPDEVDLLRRFLRGLAEIETDPTLLVAETMRKGT